MATSCPGSASTKGETEIGSLSTAVVTDEGGSWDAQPHAAMQTMSNPGRSVVHGSTRDVVNVMFTKRDAEDTQQRSKSCGEEVESTPRLPPPAPRPAHTRAVVSLDGSRCIVIIAAGVDVSLVSARMLRPGVKYLLNATDALQGLHSRESRSLGVRFWKCTWGRLGRLRVS